VCDLHRTRRDDELRFFWLSLKTKVDDLSVVCPQNYWNGFLQFGLKTCGDGISGLASKLVAMVFSAWSQNWWRRFLLIWPQNW
jgi:hypothetical protein